MAPKISFTISAINKTSQTLDRINRDMAAAGAPVARLGKQFQTLKEQSGLDAVGVGIGRVTVGATAAAVAMGALVSRWGDWGEKLEFTAQRLGMAAGQLYSFEGAARLAGASAGAMDSGLKSLQQVLFDAKWGMNSRAAAMLNAMGLHTEDATEALPVLADRLAAIKNPAMQASIGAQFFGSAFEELRPLLNQGSAGIAEFVRQANVLGATNEEHAQTAVKFEHSMTAVRMAAENLGWTFAGEVAPAVTRVADEFANWLATSPDAQKMVHDLADGVRELVGWLEEPGWDKWRDGMVSAGGDIKWVVKELGGVKAVAEELAFFLVSSWALRVGGALIGVGNRVVQLAAGFRYLIGLIRGAQAASAVATAASAAATAATGGTAAAAAAGGALPLAEAAPGIAALGTVAGAAGMLALPAAVIGYAGYNQYRHDHYQTPEENRYYDLQHSGSKSGHHAPAAQVEAARLAAERSRAAQTAAGVKPGEQIVALPPEQAAAPSGAPQPPDQSAGPVGVTQPPAPGERRSPFAPASQITAPPSAVPPQQAQAAQFASQGSKTQQLESYFEQQGWSHGQAAGVVANLSTESALRPDVSGDNGAAYGIGQWHRDRQAAFKQQFGHDIHGSSLEEQAAFVQWELKHSEAGAGRALGRAGTAAEAGAIVSSQYERPADRAGNERLRGALAERIAAAPPALPMGGAPAGPVQAAGTGSDGAAGANGKIDVTLRHENPPAGLRTIASSSGDAFSGPPRVEHAMPGFASG